MADGRLARRVLLIVPWLLDELPYGIAYLIRPARQAGFETDAWYCEQAAGWEHDLARRLLDRAYDVVGVSAGSFPVLRRVVEVCRLVRRVSPNSMLVVGGPAVSASPELVMRRTGADHAFVGEADRSWPLFLDAIAHARGVADVPGLVSRTPDGGWRTSGPAPIVADLSDVEPPPWEFFPIEKLCHANAHLLVIKERATHAILASRGCPHSCNFCFHACPYRCRSVDDVISEIRHFHDVYGIDCFRFIDSTTTANLAHFKKLCRAMAALPFEIRYGIGTRVSCVDLELLALLKASGCVGIGYGIESGDDEVLRRIGKHTTVARINEALDLTEKVGIPYHLTVMFGQVDETVESMQRTLLLTLSRPCSYWWYICQPLPGTSVYTLAKERGLIRDDDDFYERFEGFHRLCVNLTRLSDEQLKDALMRVAFVFACFHYLQPLVPGCHRAAPALVPLLWRAAPRLYPGLRGAFALGRRLVARASGARSALTALARGSSADSA